MHCPCPCHILQYLYICNLFTCSFFYYLKGEFNPIFLFHHWVRIGQTKTRFNRQFSPKRPEVGQIFILRSNFDQNKDHMTSKQVRGPSKNWHPASEGTLKTDIQQVRGPSKLTSCKWGDPILTSSKWRDAILSRIKICRELWHSLFQHARPAMLRSRVRNCLPSIWNETTLWSNVGCSVEKCSIL